jgi:hypothetical protein
VQGRTWLRAGQSRVGIKAGEGTGQGWTWPREGQVRDEGRAGMQDCVQGRAEGRAGLRAELRVAQD